MEKNWREQIARILRPTEFLRFYVEVRVLTGGKSRDRRMLAMICNTQSDVDEGVLFFLKRTGATITIREKLPIFSDFKVTRLTGYGEDTLEVTFRFANGVDTVEFDITRDDDMEQMLIELKKLINIAQDRGLASSGSSHRWTHYYSVHSPLSTIDPLDDLPSPFNVEEDGHSMISAPYGFRKTRSNPLMSFSNVVGIASNEMERNMGNNVAHDLRAVKEEWVAKQLLDREEEFTERSSMRVFAGTWNVNGRYTDESLDGWLRIEEEFDIYAIGFQELDLSAEAYLIADTTREEMWCTAIESSLNRSSSGYVKIISRQLVGMLIVIYVKSTVSDQVREVTSTSIGCGLMGMVGNKGAVAVRLRVKDSYLCFINSHLAADTYQVERRKQNYWEIVRRASFPNLALMSGLQRMSSYSTSNLTNYLPGSSQRYFGIFDNDHLIWMGDLNFRVALPGPEVKKHLEAGNRDMLLTYDQLLNERRLKSIFDGFEEGDITFAPTYKYDVGTNTFDSSEKQRTPSWCDRVLWRSRTGAGKYIKQLQYSSHPELLASDHKPVSADFEIMIKTILPEKHADVHGSIIRELDKYENECMPDVSVSRLQIDFGEVKYEQPVTETIVIENVGQVTAQCRFIPKFDEVNICKPWLWVNPPTAMLVPGDKAIISMTLLVDAMSAPPLNAGEDALEDILILHLDNGKDLFVSVSASYVPTCFATSLDRLTRLAHPIRAVNVAEVELLPPENQLSMPRELWRIIDYLQQHGRDVDGLFMQAGNPYLIAYIRDCLDTGVEFEFDTLIEESVWPSSETTLPLNNAIETTDDMMLASASTENTAEDATRLGPAHSVHAMAEVLLRFLEAMPEPVIPFDHYQRCLDASQYDKEMALQALETLPRINMNMFLYLTAFLRLTLSWLKPQMTMDEKHIHLNKLAMVFSAVLLRSKGTAPERFQQVIINQKQQFLKFFLVEDQKQVREDETNDASVAV